MAAHRFGLARQYYTVLAVVLITLAALTASSAHFARSTTDQARLVEESGLILARLSGAVELLAEQHRRLTDGLADFRDADAASALRAEVFGAEDRLREAVDQLQADPAGAQSFDRLRAGLPELFQAARSALRLADAAEGRDAIPGALADYDSKASDLADRIGELRTGRQRALDLQVEALRARAAEMTVWARVCAALTLIAAAVSWAITRRALSRLHRVTDVMLGLAAGDADVSVPEAGRLDELDDLCRAAAAFKDGTLQAQAQAQELRRTNTLFDGALNNMGHGLIMFDAAGRIEVINRRAYDLYGLDPSAVGPGSSLSDLIAHGVARGNFPGRPTADVLAEMALIATRQKAVSTWSTGGGRMVAVSHERTPDGAWITTHEDVTERRKSEEQLRFLERHDALTGLPNRLQLVERLTERLEAARADAAAPSPSAGFALHCLDVRRLRSVNDTLGHPFGDALLRQAADRLRGLARAGEFAARLEGNRFAVLQAGAQRPEEAIALARRLKRLLAQPYKVAGNDVVVGISIGIALAPSDGAAADALLRNANLALVRAKADSPGAWHFFEPGMDARAQARRRLETDLRAALGRGEFEVWYQPLVNARTRRVSGFEALLRWSHPTRGMVGPVEFIPVAEEIGVIVPLGAWALRTACAEARTWPGDLKLAVNLSSVQFRDPDLVRAVTNALDEADFPASRLDLEITESVLLQDSEATLAILHELRALGVRISMDDFGTGYSSLSYLRSFPFDKIKIDKSFISDLSDRADSLAIVRAVTGLGRSLGMATTAEGVETDAQLARLSSEGCTEVQGFLFSPPRPARELPRLLRELAATAEELAA